MIIVAACSSSLTRTSEKLNASCCKDVRFSIGVKVAPIHCSLIKGKPFINSRSTICEP